MVGEGDFPCVKEVKERNSRIDNYSANLNVLENNTDNIIDYFENTLSNDKKKYKFFELLKNDK